MTLELIPTHYALKVEFEAMSPFQIQFVRMNSPFYAGEKWAVRRGSSCLSKSGDWEMEPQPSSRDDDFYRDFRFDGLGSATLAVSKWMTHGQDAN